MAAENMKNLNTRIRLKYDTLENWLKNDPVLLDGEVAIATVSTNENNGTNFQNLPNVVMKVGGGGKKFSELNFFSAMAADVYAWAKSPTRPEYTAEDIAGLEAYIAGKVQDTNTKFKLEADANNAHILRLYSQDIGQTDWTLVNEITTADTVYDDTALAGRVTSLEGLVGAEKVSAQIANAIAALDLANTYDAKGAAAQALTDAKAYADGKDAAIQAAKDAADAAQGEIDALEEKVGEVPADKTVIGMIGENATAISNVQTELTTYKTDNDKALADEVARAINAEEANAAAAAAAQKAADDITAYVGEIPADAGVENVVGYVEKLTSDITSGTEFTELEGRVKTIEEDYLTEADKTELSDAVAAEKARAEGIEAGLRTDVDAANEAIGVLNGGADVEGSVDKKVADAFTAANLDQYATDEDFNNLQTQINTIMNNPDTEGVINSINEFTEYIASHGEIAEGFRADIDALKAAVDTGDQTVTEYVGAAIEALKIGDYAKASELTALAARVAAMEAKVANWDAAEQNAKDYADGLNTAMDTRMEAVEGKAHEHANADELDKIAEGDKAKWDEAAEKAHVHDNAEELAKFVDGDKAKLDEAYAKAHEHENAEVLGGITAEKVAAWDASETNAKEHANTLNTAMDTRMTAAEGEIAGLHAIAKSGNVNDLAQTEGEYIVLNCGTSSTII